ncbi:MAG: hypothetical protein IH964_11225 [Candidatus Dadabacteria bacterium]|nr:hypothetical protein [Candidatus Dadabacteria bacterium]
MGRSDNSNDVSEEDEDNSQIIGAVIFGGASAAAITGAIIGASTSGNGRGDRMASKVVQ